MDQQLEGPSQIRIPDCTTATACAAAIEPMLPCLPSNLTYQALGFGLHVQPYALRATFQEAIGREYSLVERIILG